MTSFGQRGERKIENMKLAKQLLLVGAGLLFTFSLSAQSPDAGRNQKSQKERKGDRMEKVKTELGLTDEQAAAWDSINEKYKAQHQKVKEANKEKRQEAKEANDAIREAHDAEITALLTPEQLEKWNQIKAEREARMIERREKHERAR